MCRPFEAQTENDVAGFDLAAIDDFRSIHDANDAACEIVFALAIHPGHLRGLAAEQRAAGRATGARKAAKQLLEHARLESFAADVIEKEKRTRAENRNVVDAMVHEIHAHGVVLVHREGDLQFRADAIDARDQNRIAHARKGRAK